MIYTESNVITLDKELKGVITIENQSTSCIFKVKANVAESIQAKPTHGLLRKDGKAIISVRFIGNVAEIDKVKLKIYYLPVTSREMPAGNIAETYKKMKQDQNCANEQFLTFAFVLYQVKHEDIMKEFRYSPNIKSEKKTQRERLGQSKHISQTSPNKEKAKQILITANEITKQSTHLSLIHIMVVAFLLGITFGIKISHLKLDHPLLS